jgi:hypothetical protein
MQPSELELCTTVELVKELVRRKTFLGVVVHCEQELKGEWVGERTFRVRFNENLSSAQAARLLEAITDYLEHDRC